MARPFHSSFSNYGKILTNADRNNFNLDSYLKQVLVGTILGAIVWATTSAPCLMPESWPRPLMQVSRARVALDFAKARVE